MLLYENRFPQALHEKYAKEIQKLQSLGHILELDEDGDVDLLAMETGRHNGPRCTRCMTGWCVHCREIDTAIQCLPI
jgi:hypothetical protein